MADAHSDSTEDLFPTLPGYPPHGDILRILGEGATSLSARLGQKYMLSLNIDGGVGVVEAFRDDGFHSAVAMLPPPDAPRFARADGERIGGEDPTPEERARMWFRCRVEAAVEAFAEAVEGFVSGHDQQGD